MLVKKLFFIITLCFVSSSVYAQNSSHYRPTGSLKERLKESIEYSKKSVDICIHDFATLQIEEYLDIARKRDLRIRVVVLGHGSGNVEHSLASNLVQKGFDVRFLKLENENDPFQDFILLDNRTLVTGAYNWMAYWDRQIHNDVLFSYNQAGISSYKTAFYKRFAEGEATPLTIIEEAKTKSLIADTKSITKQDDVVEKESASSKPVVTPEPEVTSKDFIDITFEELNILVGKESTLSSSEKKANWKKHKGKFVRWEGKVAYKGIGLFQWNRIGIIQGDGDKANVELSVSWNMFDDVASLDIDTKIRYTGKLVARPWIGSPYRLQEGNFEKL